MTTRLHLDGARGGPVTDPLMSREEVAALLGIKPDSVRSTLRRYGITELRGYPRAQVENLQRAGQGRRTDLHDHTLTASPVPTRDVQEDDMSKPDLVWINLHFETNMQGGEVDEYVSMPRGEWDAMTEAEQQQWIDEELDTFVGNHASWGGDVVDEDNVPASYRAAPA